MGRSKVVMKRIEDKCSCQVTFSKRRKGLIKKAHQLSILCDVEITLVIFSRTGKLYDFSTSQSVNKVVERYLNSNKEKARLEGETVDTNDDNEEEIYRHFTRVGSSPIAKQLQFVERNLDNPNIEQLSVADLLHLEKELSATLAETRARKTKLLQQLTKVLQEKEKKLREENENLNKIAASMKSRSMANDCHPVQDPRQTTLNLLH